MEKITELFKKPAVIFSTIVGLIGGITGFYEAYVKIKDSMNETAREKIENYTIPVVKSEIKKTVDSIFSSQKVSFRDELAKELNIERDQVSKFISEWYASQDGLYVVGLYYDKTYKKLFYIHTNGKEYRPFKDTSGYYYFINDNDKPEYCK